MSQPQFSGNGFPWEQLVLKLFDWPFLMFILVVVLIWMMRGEIRGLISRSKVKITWGDRSIELNELADNMDQDLDPLKERVEMLEEKMKELTETRGEAKTESVNIPEPPPSPSPVFSDDVKNILEIALSNPRYKYRTANGIARELKMPKDRAQEILSNTPGIRVTKSRDGRELYTKEKSN